MAKRKASHSTRGPKKKKATRAPKTSIPPHMEPKPVIIKTEKKSDHSVSQLPTELIDQILGYISFSDSLNFRLVSKRFARASERFVFQSIRLYLPRGADIPTLEQSIYFSTRMFSSGAREVRIYGDANGAAQRAGDPPGEYPSHKSDKLISAVNTGLLRKTTSVFTSLSTISLDFKENILPYQHGHGAFALGFLEALDADARKRQITTVALHNLPLWILQRLSAEKPKVLRDSLRHVRNLSLGITPHLQMDVDDRLNIYRDYHSFDHVARTQLSTAYAAFRTFLASASDVEDLSLCWFSTKRTVASWKALSPLGHPDFICKPAAGADSARCLLVGEKVGQLFWIDSEGGYTVIWQSLRKLRLTNFVICPYQLTQTVLGAKSTLVELELDSLYLNMSCQFVDWGTGVLTTWRSAYRTGTVPFRLLRFTARNLGYTSRWPDYPQASFESHAALMRG